MDAMHTTSETPKAIQIRTRISEPDEIRVDISDCGLGFEPAMAEKIFEAFYTTKANGMGVGLSSAKPLLKASKSVYGPPGTISKEPRFRSYSDKHRRKPRVPPQKRYKLSESLQTARKS
ncbi:ATP-binding protein [Neorhizobium sp. T25_27]|uniref:ATP-binding protein n=1 Tax=Neorhizobium sp. T25_27 TaxID=2093831 RepID=UPI000CF9F452